MTDFTFPPEKRLSRLTLGRVEQLNALFAEIATASATKVEFTLGNLDLNGGRAVNAGDGVNPTDLVTKQQLDATAFAPALPGQAGNAGRFISTDGTNASWVPAPVRYDIAQIRSDAERAQARSNIAAAGSAETATALGLKADAAAVNSALANKADASAVDSALAGKADKANPFADVASASTVNLGAASSLAVNITGTTTITSFGTSAPDGTEYLLKFAGALTVTNGANLVTGTGANITTFAGMLMRVVKDASNVWRVIEFTRRINVSGGGANRQVANLAAYTADRTVTWPDGDVTIPAGTLETSAKMVGIGQSYTDVTASRTNDVSYQNTSAKPIQVLIWYGLGSAAFRYVQQSPDNTNWTNVLSINTSTQSLRVNMIVPPGYYYRINGGAVQNLVWTELA